jgi:hypothetical protein
LDDPLVASARDQIATGEPGMNTRVQEVAERLDQVAWDIQDAEDEHDSERYMAAFRRARAASAVTFALDPDSGSMLESIYEAQAALGSIAAARRVIEPLLTNDWGRALRYLRLLNHAHQNIPVRTRPHRAPLDASTLKTRAASCRPPVKMRTPAQLRDSGDLVRHASGCKSALGSRCDEVTSEFLYLFLQARKFEETADVQV